MRRMSYNKLISGQVFDEYRNPVPNSIITIHLIYYSNNILNKSLLGYTTTNNMGKYSFMVNLKYLNCCGFLVDCYNPQECF